MATKIPTYDFKGVQYTKERLLEMWYTADVALAKAKADEAVLRNLVVTAYLPNGPKEGTQNIALDDGWVLNVQGKVNRKVDPALIASTTLELREKFGDNVAVEDYVKYSPELVKSAYNNLTAEQREIFDCMLVITPGTPSVEIKQPKRGMPKAVAK